MINKNTDELRFEFGQNWREFASHINEQRIAEATASLQRLFGRDHLQDRTFLDIGSGSGLFSLAAWKLGAKVHSFDFDSRSVACTVAVRNHWSDARDRDWKIEEASILDHTFVSGLPKFDLVYSWGVLHHTGDLATAMANAASLTKIGGTMAVALYRRTLLCPLWKIEKRWYINASPQTQQRAQFAFISAFGLASRAAGRDYKSWSDDYFRRRGMSHRHDVHDWLGGYPYESVTVNEVERAMRAAGLSTVLLPEKRRSVGFFGSGCDEYVFERRPAQTG